MDLVRRFREWQGGEAAAPEVAPPGGLDVVSTPHGPAYVRQTVPGDRLKPGPARPSLHELALLCGETAAPGTDWSEVSVLDLETTGLGGSGVVAFLAGVGTPTPDGIEIRQFFLPSLDAEPALLWELSRLISLRPVLITFNGKSFDWQVLVSRWILNRQVPPSPALHLDILHPARRLYGGILPSCSLTSLEAGVLDFHREDDIPGSEIPAVYFSYLARRDILHLEPVFRHNVMDIESTVLLAEIMSGLAGGIREPGPAHDPLAWAQLWLARGRHDRAEGCLRDLAEAHGASSSRGYGARVRLGLLLKSRGRFDESATCFHEACMNDDPFRGILPRIELAKHYEHRVRDLEAALRMTDESLATLRRRTAAGGRHRRLGDEIRHRRARLLRRLGR